MKTTALIAGGTCAALVVLAVAVPALIDWSRYKEQIAAQAEAATGRKVDIAGPVAVRLLPSPAITADGLSIGNPPGALAAQPLAKVQRLKLRVALFPLFVGRVKITSLELDHPELHLARSPDGSPNWRLAPSAPPPAHGRIRRAAAPRRQARAARPAASGNRHPHPRGRCDHSPRIGHLFRWQRPCFAG